MKLCAIGIDSAKNVFTLVALDSSGQVVIRKRCSRMQVLAFTASVEVGVIGMEACDTARFLEFVMREQGHRVCLVPLQRSKTNGHTNGHEYLGAEAIAEAVRVAYGGAQEMSVSPEPNRRATSNGAN